MERRSTLHVPPFLLAAVLIFWGWQTGFLMAGLLMGLLLEVSRWVRARWSFSQDEFNQLWNITAIAVVGGAVFAFTANEGPAAITGFFNAATFTERSSAMNKATLAALAFMQWMPMIFFPFTAAQAFSSQEKIDFKVFSWFLRRAARKGKTPANAAPGRGVNVGYPYFGICLIAASAIKDDTRFFYPGLCGLMLWALWPHRCRRFAPVWWFATVSVAALIGLGGIKTLRGVQYLLNNFQADWFTAGGRGFDAKESRTSMGAIGTLKGSSRIMLRVEIPDGNPVPHLLRQAVYQNFTSPTWRSTSRTFSLLNWETNETSWILSPVPGSNAVTIASYLDGGRGLLCAPEGLRRFDNLPVFQLETNYLGVIRSASGPGLVIYTARYGAGPTYEGGPEAGDLGIPDNELPAIEAVLKEIGAGDLPLAEQLKKIDRFFAKNFAYSLYQGRDSLKEAGVTPLTKFLLTKRSGHCEFFATATVLLLRQMHIPARYVAGYSVQESSGHNRYVVRDRHAHAWCLYYDADAKAWRDFDTTPGGWVEAENSRRSFWEPFSDLWSRCWFEFSKMRWGQSALRPYLSLAIIPLVLFLFVRFIIKKGWRLSKQGKAAAAAAVPLPGQDSEFYLIERKLAALQLTQLPGETLRAWLFRVRENLPPGGAIDDALLTLHYRLRFDPAGLTAEERDALRAGVQSWLARTATVG